MAQEQETNAKRVDYRLLRRLLGFLKPYRMHLIGGVLLTLVSSALGPLRPFVTRIAVDDNIEKGDLDGLVLFIGIIFGLVIIQGAAQYALSLLMTWIGQRVLLDIRNTLFKHVQALSLRFYDTTPVGRVVTRVTNDVEVLNELFSAGVVLMISDIMVILWILTFMWNTSPQLTMLTIVILPFLLVASFVFRAKVRVVYTKIRSQVARMNSFINEFITGMTVVQLFRQESRMEADFRSINKTHRELQDRSIMYYATFFPVVEFLSSVALAIIVWYASKHIGSGEMTVGMLIAFAQFTEMFFRPVRDLTEKYNTLQSSVVASERIFSMLDTKLTIDDAPGAHEFTGLTTGIEFSHVDFSYDGTTQILSDASFKVRKGETLAIVGATGAGKSSIINLLCRFYEYQSGDILVDGRSLRSVRQVDFRKRIAVVLQDVFLFSRSVHENIALGRTDISRADVQRIAQQLGAHGFISRLPHGYDTNVRERGAVLSVGQKQLISFCRALAQDPDILILDEATSSIDTESEQLIEASISTMLKGRTSIVIAHRLSTIQRADRILVLHKGEVAESGTHAELLAANGLYAKLHTLQFAQNAA